MAWPVIECVRLATGVITTPEQGSTGGGGGGVGVGSDLEQAANKTAAAIAVYKMVFFIELYCIRKFSLNK